MPEEPKSESSFEKGTPGRTKMGRQKKSDEENQGHGLKILTPNQMLCRLPISLSQLKPGNNSENLKNKIRQLYSLYSSKK